MVCQTLDHGAYLKSPSLEESYLVTFDWMPDIVRLPCWVLIFIILTFLDFVVGDG